MQNVRKLLARAGVTVAAVVPAISFAAIDTSAAETAITEGTTAAAAIGGGVLALLVGIAIYRHIRRAA